MDRSALEYMLYHQNNLAHVNPGKRRRAACHTFSPATSRLDCRHNQISDCSLKYQPLPTMPCCRGRVPVTIVDCAAQVTAGKTPPSGIMNPSRASAARAG